MYIFIKTLTDQRRIKIIKLLKPGDEVISTNDLYGGTFRLFTQVFRAYGIKFHFVGMDQKGEIEKKINPICSRK